MKRFLISAASFILAGVISLDLAELAYAAGNAPTAENLELRTARNTLLVGQLLASDPDDDVAGFEITTMPVKGQIELAADGSFRYMPDKDRKGRDYFGYKAFDREGNWSQEATAIIRIEKA